MATVITLRFPAGIYFLLLLFPSTQTLVDVCRLLPQTKVPELVVGLVALAVLIVVKEINNCYRQKLPFPIPIEIVVVSTLLSLFHFHLIACCFSSKSTRG